MPRDARGKFIDGYVNSLPDNFGSVADFTSKPNGAEQLTAAGPQSCGRDAPAAANVGAISAAKPPPQVGPAPDDTAPRNLIEQARLLEWEAQENRASFVEKVGDVVGLLDPTSRETNAIGVSQPVNPLTGEFMSVDAQEGALLTTVLLVAPTPKGMRSATPEEVAEASATARRVTLRSSTRQQIRANQPRDSSGNMVHPNTGQPLRPGQIDVGHKPGQEWRVRKAMHEAAGSNRRQVIEAENDPALYRLEDRSSNRSHRYEEE